MQHCREHSQSSMKDMGAKMCRTKNGNSSYRVNEVIKSRWIRPLPRLSDASPAR